mmetsp:Transcript_3056/g.6364  ORF Transcript_3056/g.6364 Transcript_3056/m.6364 type:complete len:269 (-) Transcript_3056:2457-3263(-)
MLHRSFRSIYVLLAVAIPSIALGWSTSRISSTRNQHTRLQMSSSDTSNKLKVLGVCGGIGSGKSTACKLLVDHCKCLAHIDADKVAHAVYAPGSNSVKDVVAEFGDQIILASSEIMEIDRKKLGAIVFSERSQMAKLEQIVWPHVRTMLVEKIDELKEEFNQTDDKQPVIVLEAAILLDAGWEDLLDGVWAVTAPSEKALDRLVETRGLTPEEAQKRIDAQASRKGIGSSLDKEVQEGVVHCVVQNDGTLDDLKETLQKSLEDPKCWK